MSRIVFPSIQIIIIKVVLPIHRHENSYSLSRALFADKQILDRALDDVGFWLRHSQLKRREKVVWLLLYDMQGRKFARIGGSAALAMRNEALREAGLLDVEQALLDLKTRLAASLSRLRIGGSALSLGISAAQYA